jgi:hypothetical protein
VYSPATLAAYAAAAARCHRLRRPVEDTRQLGADAIMADGVVRQLWRPRSPNDRPPASQPGGRCRPGLAGLISETVTGPVHPGGAAGIRPR